MDKPNPYHTGRLAPFILKEQSLIKWAHPPSLSVCLYHHRGCLDLTNAGEQYLVLRVLEAFYMDCMQFLQAYNRRKRTLNLNIVLIGSKRTQSYC